MPKLEVQKPVPVERKVFAKNLKDARAAAGYTLQELSALTHLTYQYISDMERGLHNISLLSMSSLSVGLRVPLYALLNPNLSKVWTFNDEVAWSNYQKLIDDAKPAVLEQLLLAKNVRRYRKEAGLTQKETDQLGNYKAGLTSDIERQYINITLDRMAPLVSILGISLHKIFDPNS